MTAEDEKFFKELMRERLLDECPDDTCWSGVKNFFKGLYWITFARLFQRDKYRVAMLILNELRAAT